MQQTEQRAPERSTSHVITWWTILVSFLMPMVPLLYLYQKNATELQFLSVALVCLGLGVISLLAFLFGAVVFRARLSGLLLALVVSVCLVLLKPIHGAMYDLAVQMGVRFSIVALMVGIPALALLLAGLLLVRKLPVVTGGFFAFFICLLFAMNAFSSVRYIRQTGSEYTIKNEYTVDETLDSPNIYFFFMDGAMGLDVFDLYYQEETAPFRAAMEEQGFSFDGSAMLNAKHSTGIVMPVIFCPSFDDSFLEKTLAANESMDRDTFMATYSKELNATACNNELLMAFRAKGYASYVITGEYDPFVPMQTDRFYLVDHHISSTAGEIYTATNEDTPYSIDINFNPEEISGMAMLDVLSLFVPDFLTERAASYLGGSEEQAFLADLRTVPDTLTDAQIDSLFDGNEVAIRYYEGLAQSLNETVQLSGPKVVIIHNLMLHLPYGIQNADYERGPWPDGETDLPDFEGHYLYTLDVLERMTQLVLENDPNAVIIVQGDHGIHGEWYESAISARFGADAVVPFQDSTLSGIRVPADEQDADLVNALESPRNISRWLVNRFVGQNYEYIQTDD